MFSERKTFLKISILGKAEKLYVLQLNVTIRDIFDVQFLILHVLK